MAGRQSRSIGNARIGAAAAVVVVGALAAIYVTANSAGNVAEAGSCAASVARARALEPLVGGEVAAFLPASHPERLDGLAFTGVDGRPTTLAAYGGKVALVNLWATWCAPCRKEMPALERLQTALGGADFAVVPISVDAGDAQRPRAFLAGIGVKNLPLNTDSSMEILQAVKRRGLALGLPVTLLIDRDGCHLGHMNGPAEWDSAEGLKLIEAAIGTGRPPQP